MLKHNLSKNMLRLDESGFTLLEIIAVLVILSIMAVVAVPKYFDLQEQAREKAMKTALAEALGRVNGYFAQEVLSGRTPGQIDYTIANLGADIGDFELTHVVGGASNSGQSTFYIEVKGNDDTVLKGYTDSRRVTKPGF